jgi:hypothetical protein
MIGPCFIPRKHEMNDSHRRKLIDVEALIFGERHLVLVDRLCHRPSIELMRPTGPACLPSAPTVHDGAATTERRITVWLMHPFLI